MDVLRVLHGIEHIGEAGAMQAGVPAQDQGPLLESENPAVVCEGVWALRPRRQSGIRHFQ